MGKARTRIRRPARRGPVLAPKHRLLVVCEGIVTEPQYLRGLQRWANNAGIVEIFIPNEQGDPRKLVEIAKDYRSNAVAEATREGDDFLLFDEVWCVCDVDDHSRLADARQMAHDNGIEMAVSNPCFELWLLLHFRGDPGSHGRKSMRSMLAKFLAGYDKHLEFHSLSDGVMEALKRARHLHKIAKESGAPNRNPTTSVFRLVESILEKGAKEHTE